MREQLPTLAIPIREESVQEKGHEDGGTESTACGFRVKKKQRHNRDGK